MNKKIIQKDVAETAEMCPDVLALEGESLLVTGAYGFLPAYMVNTVEYLNENVFKKPCRIYVVVRSLGRLRNRFKGLVDKRYFKAILQDASKPLPDIGRMDYMVHAASHADPAGYLGDPVGTIKANAFATYFLLEYALRRGTKGFLYFSSAEVYGGGTEGRAIAEGDFGPLDPTEERACYFESKRMGETLCSSYHARYGLRTVTVRPFHVYGPGVRLEDGRVFGSLISSIALRKPIVLKTKGEAVRSFCYLGDANAAFFRVLMTGESGEAYNIGNPEETYSIIGIAGLLGKRFGLEVVPGTDDACGGAALRIVPDTSKARALGVRMRVGVEEGFGRSAEHYR